jgi:peptide/nickel transport system permease protein
VLQSIPLLLPVSALVFWLIHSAPGGPLAIYLSNPNVRPEDIERLRRALGLDRSIWQQYWSWLAAFAHGDWGYSFSDGRPVSMRIIERIPATLELVATSILVALALTLPVGVVAAVGRGRWFDRATTAVAAAGISLPAFWFGLLLQMVFAIGLGWVPSSGRTTIGGGDAVDHLQHLLLPVTVLAVVQAAAWSRYLRGSMIEVLTQPFVLAAQARGIPERAVILRHALRNAIGPVLAVVMATRRCSRAVVTERVRPGLGSLFAKHCAPRLQRADGAADADLDGDRRLQRRRRCGACARRSAGHGLMRGPALLLACLIAAAIVAPVIAPYPPDRLDLAHRREAPSIAHLFGTDDLGRDVLARVLFGARVSLAVGLLSAAVAAASGVAVGGVAGYAGGAVDAILMRLTDAMLAVPRLPLLMIAASILEPSVVLPVFMIGWQDGNRLWCWSSSPCGRAARQNAQRAPVIAPDRCASCRTPRRPSSR